MFCPGVLITGGDYWYDEPIVEVFVPQGNLHCQLPLDDLKYNNGHTQDGFLICGGMGNTSRLPDHQKVCATYCPSQDWEREQYNLTWHRGDTYTSGDLQTLTDTWRHLQTLPDTYRDLHTLTETYRDL